MKRIVLDIPQELWRYVELQATDRAHDKGYTIEDMLEDKPQKDQILKWIREIRDNKIGYRRK